MVSQTEMTLLIGTKMLSEKLAAAGKRIPQGVACLKWRQNRSDARQGNGAGRGLPMKAFLLVWLMILFLAPALHAQETKCDTITLAEGQSMNLERACKLFLDLTSYHLLGRSRPGTHFHILDKLDCSRKAYLAQNQTGEVVGCGDRSKAHTDIYLLSDDPQVYLPILAMALDYANQTYLEPKEIRAQCQQVFDEYTRPQMRERNHATVSIKDLRSKPDK